MPRYLCAWETKRTRQLKPSFFYGAYILVGKTKKKNCIVHHMAAFAVEKNEAARATGEAEKMEKDMG